MGGQPDLVIVFFITKEPSFSCLSAKMGKQPVGAGWEFYFRGAVMPPQMHTQQVTIMKITSGRNPLGRRRLMGPTGIRQSTTGLWVDDTNSVLIDLCRPSKHYILRVSSETTDLDPPCGCSTCSVTLRLVSFNVCTLSADNYGTLIELKMNK